MAGRSAHRDPESPLRDGGYFMGLDHANKAANLRVAISNRGHRTAARIERSATA